LPLQPTSNAAYGKRGFHPQGRLPIQSDSHFFCHKTKSPAALRGVFEHTLITALAFVAFGVSDIIEISTGARWHPWCLFALKAGGVLTFTPAVAAWLELARKKPSPPTR